MDCKIKKMSGMKLIGFEKEFSEENSYEEVPELWDEVMGKYAAPLVDGKEPASAIEKAVKECGVGEYGVCIDDVGGGKFRYLIAGEYMGGEVPGGMALYEFPDCDWAVFDCYGPLPEKLQELNTKIFGEWLPGNAEYELSGNATIEWYDMGDTKSDDYHSAIWLPVKRK